MRHCCFFNCFLINAFECTLHVKNTVVNAEDQKWNICFIWNKKKADKNKTMSKHLTCGVFYQAKLIQCPSKGELILNDGLHTSGILVELAFPALFKSKTSFSLFFVWSFVLSTFIVSLFFLDFAAKAFT